MIPAKALGAFTAINSNISRLHDNLTNRSGRGALCCQRNPGSAMRYYKRKRARLFRSRSIRVPAEHPMRGEIGDQQGREWKKDEVSTVPGTAAQDALYMGPPEWPSAESTHSI